MSGRLVKKHMIFLAVFCACTCYLGLSAHGQTPKSVPPAQSIVIEDSLLKNYTPEDLATYRDKYMREVTRLERERVELRRKGIRDGEIFLNRQSRSKVADKVMMRMGELYFEEAQEAFQQAMQEYDRLYNLYDRGQLLEPPREPVKNYDSAFKMYNGILERYPQSDLVDDALYSYGFLLEDLGNIDSAQVMYERLISDYPDSRLVPEAMMRIAEYYFNNPMDHGQRSLEIAIDYYKRILDYRDSPRYDEALYRLGWSNYRLNKYPEAISYFTILADDVTKSSQFDPKLKYTNPALIDESIEYIGISFIDYGGAERAADYIETIGGREYGSAILRRIGDAYMDEKEDYDKAIEAYSLLLDMYPYDAEAPEVQNRIVQAYRRLDDERMAYFSRDLLFRRYNKGSDWFQNNPDETVRQKAAVLCESVLRDNITILLRRGNETGQIDFYYQLVQASKEYLQTFPSDTSAPLIHWNMAVSLDMKLKRPLEAYEEYIKISTHYWDSKYQKYAAEYAIALAMDAAAEAIAIAEAEAAKQVPLTIGEMKEKASSLASFREHMRLERTELSEPEKRLAAAYNNFIKLFPHDPKTATMLSNAGALCYGHHQFKEALKYYNTMVKHFPGSEEIGHARFNIMESYFGKMDFRSAEIIARRIVYSDASDEIKSKARHRLAVSIYLSAELLAEELKHIEAGDEYFRVVKEVPRSEFADLAVFKSATEYDEANEYMRAIETYNYLIATHPQSKYVVDAVNNLAFDYVELRDYKNAALTYERLAAIHPDPEKARDALYNASIFFFRAEDWQNTIKANKLFVERFPDADEADELYYDIAGYYRKLNEEEKAAEAYSDFVEKYPNSPRVVEGLFSRGEYFRKIGQNTTALVEYRRALAKNNELKELGLDRNDYYAAEAEFGLATVKFEEFDEIEFLLPRSQQDRARKRKRDLLLEVVKHYSAAASYGTPRLYEATFMIGTAYQEFAETWARQEIPEMDATHRVVAKKEINETAADLYERAASSYRNSIEALERLAGNYEASLREQMPEDTTKVVIEDSLLRAARGWIERSKHKVTEVNYDITEISLSTAKALLNAPVPSGLGKLRELIYRKRLLEQAVAPLCSETITAFQNNLVEADSLGIDNQWVELSRQRIVSTSNLMPNQYSQIAHRALRYYEKSMDNYAELIYSGAELDQVQDRVITASENIETMLEFAKATAITSADKYIETLVLAADVNIDNDQVRTTQDSMLASLLWFGLKCDSLATHARNQNVKATALFRKTDQPIYEEGKFAFESAYLSLRNVEQEILELGHRHAQELGIQNIWAKNLTLQLIRFDPEKYAGLLHMTITQQEILTDTTWLVSPDYHDGWVEVKYNDSGWDRAMLVDSVDFEVEGLGNPLWLYLEIPVVDRDAGAVRIEDTLRVEKTKLIPTTMAYFRKTFSVKGLPVSCNIEIIADQAYNLFFNGQYIARQTNEDSDWITVYSHDLSDFLNKGTNVVAIQVENIDNTTQGLRSKIIIRILPNWDVIEDSLRPELANEKVQEQLILDRGRIP